MPRGIGAVRIVALERNLCAKLTPADHELAAGFLHFCDDWDGLLIDREDPEFDCCHCTFSDDYDAATGKLSASAMSAGTAETAQQAQGEARQRDPKGDAHD